MVVEFGGIIITNRGEDRPNPKNRRVYIMYVDFKRYKDEGAYEVKYSFSETGLRQNPAIATFNTLQDAGLFIRYMLGKDLTDDQIEEIELLICRQDIIRMEHLNDEKKGGKKNAR
jgi:hypothetical protein